MDNNEDYTNYVLLLFLIILFYVTNETTLHLPTIKSALQNKSDSTPYVRPQYRADKWLSTTLFENHINALKQGRVYGIPTNVKDMIKLHEGTKKRGGLHIVYRDTSQLCNGGCKTIGYGHLIVNNQLTYEMIGRHGWNGEGITDAEADRLFEYDYDIHLKSLYARVPWVKNLDSARQAVLIDMNFNLGTSKLLKFNRSLDLIRQGKYSEAADNLKHTLWYKQVGSRSKRLCGILESGRIGL